MRYQNAVPGRFLSRPNRFIARVETAEGVRTVHVKNTVPMHIRQTNKLEDSICSLLKM